MTVEYKGKKYENVESISFDSSNELGFCVHMTKDVIGIMPTIKYQVTTLEGINVNELKITR